MAKLRKNAYAELRLDLIKLKEQQPDLFERCRLLPGEQ
jgi:hypothetical protein